MSFCGSGALALLVPLMQVAGKDPENHHIGPFEGCCRKPVTQELREASRSHEDTSQTQITKHRNRRLSIVVDVVKYLESRDDLSGQAVEQSPESGSRTIKAM